MKKLILLALTLTLFAGISNAQTPFGFVEKYGFATSTGGSQRPDIASMVPFKGNLYVATGADSGQVFRSPSGNPGTFTKVYSNTSVSRADHLTVTNDGPVGGYLFMSVQHQNGAPDQILRSSNGLGWQLYYQCSTYEYIDKITMFKAGGTVDSVYFVVDNYNTSSSVVMKGAIDANDPTNASGSFTPLIDMYAAYGVSYIDAACATADTLYYTGNGVHLYKTGGNGLFSENTNFNATVGLYPGTDYVPAMTTFNGELYFGDHNYGYGASIWKTSDGINYSNVHWYTFDSAVVFRTIYGAGGRLWTLAQNNNDEMHIFSLDAAGTSRVDNYNEFGNPDNDPYNGCAITSFQNSLYIGVSNTYGGGGKRLAATKPGHTEAVLTPLPAQVPPPPSGQVWRTCLLDTIPLVTIPGSGDTSICPGGSISLTANSPTAVSYLWNNNITTASATLHGQGYYTVTATDAAGCVNSAEFWVVNAASVPVVYTDSSGTTNMTNTLVCSNDTSVNIWAHPEHDFAALNMPGQNQGMVAPGSTAFAARQITIELWMKPSTGANGQVLTEYDPDSTTWAQNDHDMIEFYGNSIYLEMPWTGGNNEFNMGTTIPTGQWSHVVLRYDGNTLTGFVNGVLDGNSITGTWSVPPSGKDAFKVGNGAVTGYGNLTSFLGDVRDVRIWNVARTDIEIQTNMNGLPAGTYPNLIYYYKMDEGSGNVANDNSGNNNNSVSVAGTFVTQDIVTIAPAASTISLGNNHFQFHPAQTTTYTATYTNSTGCAVTAGTFTVDVPKMDFTGSTPAVCGGNLAEIYLAPSGTYSWVESVTTYTIPPVHYEPNPQPTVPTWYHVTGTTWNGNCLLSDSILIGVGPSFVSNMGSPAPLSGCEGSNVTLDAMTSGGTAPYTYFWTFDGYPVDTTHTDTLIFALPAYSAPVTLSGVDAIGCPLDLQGSNGYFVTPSASTDLYGHVTAPPPVGGDVYHGYVYVFNHHPGSAAYDTLGYTTLDATGHYDFSPLTAGNYLIKVLADEDDFPTAVPSYYGNTFQWDSSLVYTHGCTQTDTADIQIVLASGPVGTATISGYIMEGPGFGMRLANNGHTPNTPFIPGGPLKGIDVKLGKNPGGGIQARTMSDTSATSQGFYEFTNVPPGDYKIYVDIPNLPMDSTRQVHIAGTDSSVQNNYFVDSTMIYIADTSVWAVGISSSAKVYDNHFSIYPNPVQGDMYLSYELKQSAKVSFEIRTAMGQLIREEPYRTYPEGKNVFILNAQQLNMQAGVYFVSILSDGKKYTQRVVIIE